MDNKPRSSQCSWELFALFEAQQQQTEACRDILRRYVEAYGSVECWLFYGNTELSVFKDADRAALVYETAMKSLPSEYVNGMKDIRIPLARADALVAAGRYDEAREFYHSLLKECTSVNALDDIFTAYKRFERLHGKSENHEAVASLIARAMYQQRIVRNPCDLDAHVSLFLILRETARGGGVSDKGDGFAAVNSEALWGEALQCLSSAVNVHVDVGTDTISAQKHAVVVMAFARLAEACGDVTSARAGLAECIRRFPFKLASCPRLWIEASSLEERHRDFAQARKLLGASLNISACPELFDAALQLEKNACTSGEVTPEDCVNRSRAIYQSAIKQFPHDLSLWEGYAKMEEQEEQFCRSDALRSACIRSFTVAARALASMTDRYEMLGKVDQVWAKRLALKRRLLRSAKKKLDGSTGETNAVVEEISSSIKNLYRELLDSVWDEYKYEALCWWKKIVATTGVLSPPPPRLPEALSPPIARWTEAVSAVTSFIVTPTQYDSCCDPSSAEWMRTIFRDRFERERPELLRELGGLDDNASFEAIQQSKRWVEFLLSPNGTEWRRFEATYGTPETLEASKEYMQPTVRRTRLFRQKRAS
uniref:Uncharacterized protein TCIL3000_10_8690 n=1 Tax=Trypanosoma congolense (strain IL3000) TaxID=1068625 RepID=G0UXH6_TRYCI|nr:unnamed protein product [Trypanosoma congolense IL3000]